MRESGSGREGKLGFKKKMEKRKGYKTTRRNWDGSAEDKSCGCGIVIKVVDKRVWFAVCKIALQLVKCSAMQADIKRCDSLHRTLDVLLKGWTWESDNAEKAEKETGTR